MASELQKQSEVNSRTLRRLSAALKTKEFDLGELFGMMFESAWLFGHQLGKSIISTQYPNLGRSTDRLIEQCSGLPDLDEARGFAKEMLKAMKAQGQVERYKARVYFPSGGHQVKDVVRIGNFEAMTGEDYLYYSSAGKLELLPHQPPLPYRIMAARLSSAAHEFIGVGIDPTRGEIIGAFGGLPYEAVQPRPIPPMNCEKAEKEK